MTRLVRHKVKMNKFSVEQFLNQSELLSILNFICRNHHGVFTQAECKAHKNSRKNAEKFMSFIQGQCTPIVFQDDSMKLSLTRKCVGFEPAIIEWKKVKQELIKRKLKLS